MDHPLSDMFNKGVKTLTGDISGSNTPAYKQVGHLH
jgi:hypothetical protein